jgi:hypothetical protein
MLAIAERKEYRTRHMMCDARGGWEVGSRRPTAAQRVDI